MGSFTKKQRRAYTLVGMLLFVLLFPATFQDRGEGTGRYQVDIVAFGDSEFGEVRDGTAVPSLLQELIDRSVFNAGMGGTCLARLERDKRLDYAKGSLSMTGLAKAIWAGDFGVQRTARIRESMTEYFPEVVAGLAEVDFSRVEIVLIQQGLNDYHAGVPIENPEDPWDEYTFLGALRSSVYALRKANPDIRIVVVSPIYTWYTAKGTTCQEEDQGGGVLEVYVEALERAAGELELEFIDMYHDLYPHEEWEDWKRYTRDGMHLNEAGRRLMAEKIARELDSPQRQK
jgi:lysophospholipase L1-like esterase